MKPTPNLPNIEAGVDSLPAIALLAPYFTLPVHEIFSPREKVG